jgi:ABC-type transport system involved in multi-copper enzyme maturation permease subunit
MSTASADTSLAASDVRHLAVVRRFAWKELRVLRSLWVAVLVMGAVVQISVHAFTPPALDQAMMLFCVALGATVLYAVGAASTIFAVEHEEETYEFLAGLPTTWLPMFAGKLAIVMGSSLALAAVLSVIGWMLCGFDIPGGHDTPGALGLFGVAVLEGIAWGTLFSLLVKRPLVAAVLTVVIGAVTVNAIVTLTTSYAVASMNPDAYVEAVPVRLLVTAVLLLVSGVIARRWIGTNTKSTHPALFPTAWRNRIQLRTSAEPLTREIVTEPASRRTLLARLVWQTWREAGMLLFVPLAVGLLLMFGMSAASWVVTIARSIPESTPAILMCTLFFVPALYGSMAFSADQRRDRYRFLAEHAGRPRFVWLARHIVWLGALAVVALVLILLAQALLGLAMRFFAANALENISEGLRGPEIDYDFVQATQFAVQGTKLAAIGMLTAYSIGQLCSMLVRSEILAAFIALVLAAFLSAWIALVFAWQLSGWLFVFPLAAGLMFATWLRAPAWIAGRNTWRSWIAPALAVVASISLVAGALPAARLAQIGYSPAWQSTVPTTSGYDAPEARETADMYHEAAALMHSWKTNDVLDRWLRPEFMEDGSAGTIGGIDESKIPADERQQYREAVEAQEQLIRDAQSAAVKLATEASARPFCYFDFDVRQISNVPRHPDRPWKWKLDSVAPYQAMIELLGLLSSAQPSEPFDRLLAALRMSAHLAAGQPSVIWLDQIQHEQRILQKIGQWADHDGRTREELESALAQLMEHFRLWGSLQEALYADHRLVHDVIIGRQPSLVVTEEPASLPVQLAAMLNELPWERRRALAALDEITRYNLRDADAITRFVLRDIPRELGNTGIRRWLRTSAHYPTYWPANWILARPVAATSYLARFEYAARTPVHELYRAYCDGEVCRRAAILQIALAMYRVDHGEYPERLSQLVPNYLEALPLDPYVSQPFEYESKGLDLLLVRWSAFSNFEQIDPNTPLLWSSGAGNARLKQWERTQPNPTTDEATGTVPEAVPELVYILASEEQFWWGEPALAFPLK